MPPISLAATNISPCCVEATSQVGSRLAVASMANSSRPRPPPAVFGGRLATSRVKSSTAEEVAVPLVGPTSVFLATATCKERQPPLSMVVHAADNFGAVTGTAGQA